MQPQSFAKKKKKTVNKGCLFLMVKQVLIYVGHPKSNASYLFPWKRMQKA